jgi:hypothetical protein
MSLYWTVPYQWQCRLISAIRNWFVQVSDKDFATFNYSQQLKSVNSGYKIKNFL